jgi:hypothetical protein
MECIKYILLYKMAVLLDLKEEKHQAKNVSIDKSSLNGFELFTR